MANPWLQLRCRIIQNWEDMQKNNYTQMMGHSTVTHQSLKLSAVDGGDLNNMKLLCLDKESKECIKI